MEWKDQNYLRILGIVILTVIVLFDLLLELLGHVHQ